MQELEAKQRSGGPPFIAELLYRPRLYRGSQDGRGSHPVPSPLCLPQQRHQSSGKEREWSDRNPAAKTINYIQPSMPPTFAMSLGSLDGDPTTC
jgi:hypothetical protein